MSSKQKTNIKKQLVSTSQSKNKLLKKNKNNSKINNELKSKKDKSKKNNVNNLESSNLNDNNVKYEEDYRQFYLNYDSSKNKTSKVMTKYEKAAVLGIRAQQIACGAIPLIEVTPDLNNAVDIAEEELRQKKTPFIIERDTGNGNVEHIKVREMIIY